MSSKITLHLHLLKFLLRPQKPRKWSGNLLKLTGKFPVVLHIGFIYYYIILLYITISSISSYEYFH